MTSRRRKDRSKPVRCGVLVSVFGVAVTIQNNSPGGLPLMDDLALANVEFYVLLRPLGTSRISPDSR
jgi:hypothetical protein